MKKVAIIGFGYVGRAMTRFFHEKFDVRVYDPYLKGTEEELALPNVQQEAKKPNINACDLAIVCVPTPMGEGGVVDLSIVEESIAWLETPLILIKSTVPPGTTQNLRVKTGKKIVFSPEYIGEGNYPVPFWKDYPHPTDMRLHSFTTLGGLDEDTHAVLQFFKKVAGAEMRYSQTDSTTAELAKYMENAFLGTKVIFCNEFARIAETLGVDYDELRELWLQDGRIGRSHTAVHEDNRGFGGKCLPKDINGIVQAVEAEGYEPKLLKTVLEVNSDLRKDYKD